MDIWIWCEWFQFGVHLWATVGIYFVFVFYLFYYHCKKIKHSIRKKKQEEKSRYAVSRYAVTPLLVSPLRILLKWVTQSHWEVTNLIFHAENVNQIVCPTEASAIEEVGAGEIDLELGSGWKKFGSRNSQMNSQRQLLLETAENRNVGTKSERNFLSPGLLHWIEVLFSLARFRINMKPDKIAWQKIGELN